MAFLNIFSNKKIKEKSPITIIVDHREKNSLVIAELISLNIHIDFRQLEVADYLIGDIAIERKTGADLISSMITKRIFSQIEDIKQYDRSLIIVEGYQDLDLRETKLNENAIRGLMLSLILDHRMPIIFTKNEKETAIFISLLAKRKKSEFSLRSKLKMSDNQRLQFIIEGFPSIGPKTAKKLLEKYKTIKNIINANPDEVRELLGKKADMFLNLLNKIYEEDENSRN